MRRKKISKTKKGRTKQRRRNSKKRTQKKIKSSTKPRRERTKGAIRMVFNLLCHSFATQ
jgi:hypothetical protein